MSGTTIFNWNSAVSADWTTSGDWSQIGYPNGSTDAASIAASGAYYTVSLSAGDPLITIASLSITYSGANLSIASVAGAETVIGDLLNDGDINLDDQFYGVGGSTLAIGGTLTNTGNVAIGGSALGASTTLTAAALDNTGVLSVTATGETASDTASVLLGSAAGFGAGGTVTGQVNLNGSVVVSFGGGGEIGTIASGAQLLLYGGASIADSGEGSNSALSGLTENDGDLTITGETLTLAGNFLSTDQINLDNQFYGAGGSTLTIGGTLINTGNVNIGGSALGASTTLAAAALDNTGVLNVTATGETSADTANVLLGSAAGFGTAGTVTGQVNLDGSVVVSFAGGGEIGTIASGAQLLLYGGASIADSGEGSNSALSGLTENDGDLTITGETLTLAGNFLSTDQINLDNQFYGAGGSTLTIGGTLTNTGYVNIGSSALGASTTLTAAALDNTGVLSVTATGETASDTASVLLGSAAGFGAGGTVTGQVNLNGSVVVSFEGGGEIGTIASGAQLLLYGGASIADSGEGSNSALSGLTANDGDLTITGETLTLTGNFLSTDQINLDNQFYGAGGSTLTIGGTLTNTGNVNIGSSALGASTTLVAAALDNTGVLNVTATGETSADTANVLLGSAAGFGTAGTVTGQVNLDGSVVVSFAGGGEIGTIASGAQLLLYGGASIADSGQGSNSALSGLTENDGDLTITGETLTLAGNFLSTDQINLDNQFYGAGGSTLIIGGTLTNTGNVNMGGSALGASTTLAAAALDNTGVLNVTATGETSADTASVLLGSAAGFGTAGTVTGQVNLDGSVVVSFAGGGEIGTIASGAQLLLYGGASIADSGEGSNSALSGLTENDGDLTITGETLSLAGNFLSTDQINLDNQFYGAGGSTLTIGGTLTNTGYVNIGGSALGASTTLAAAALDNTGVLNVTATGETSADTASVLLGSAAGFGTAGTVTGQVNLDGSVVVSFAGGGEIGTIASGAQLLLYGGASIADSGEGSNSALSGLTENDGDLTITGETLTLTGNFLSTDQINLDNQFYGAGGSTLTIGGTLINTGNVNMGGSALGASTTLAAAALDNTGVLNVTATGETSADTANVLLGSAAGFGTAGTVTGQVNLDGSVVVSFAGGGEIGTIASGAQLLLYGGASIADSGEGANSALAGLTGDAGNLSLADETLTLSGGLTNTDQINLDDQYYAAGGSRFAIDGTLANAGNVTIGGGGLGASTTLSAGALDNTNDITLAGSAATAIANLLVTGAATNDGAIAVNGYALADIAGSLAGTGDISIGGNGELELGAAAASALVTFNGTAGLLMLDQPMAFSGTIDGFVIGDTIALGSIDAIGATATNDVLSVYLLSGATVDYALVGDFIGDNFSAIENAGNSYVTAALGPPPPPPTLDVPSSATVTAVTATPLSPITIGDDDDAATLRATIIATTGTLEAAASGTGSVLGNETGTITLIGSLSVLTTELASLDYIGATLGTDPNAGPASDQVVVTITDNRDQSTSGTIAVTIDQVPYTTPTITAPAIFTYIPGVITDIPGLSVSDPFAAATGETLTFETQAPGAALYASGPGGATITGQGTGTLDITGSVQQINDILADGEGANAPGNVTIGPFNFTIPGFGNAANALSGAAAAGGSSSGSSSGNSSGGTASGASSGHANLATFDGGSYSFNPEGEFILAESTVPGDTFQVQARYTPWDNSTSGSTTVGIAAMVGTDRVTFQVGRTYLLMVNGQPTALSEPNEVLNLPGGGGQVIELSANSFKVIWNTGEQMEVDQNYESTGPYLDAFITLAPNAQPGSVQGLLGTDSGVANDFTTSTGAVLQQPLTTTQLYDDFGDSWRVPAGTQGLFDYPAGENTDNFTDPNFPFDIVTLSNFPVAQVQQAESLATAAGLTNPTLIDNAALNYLVTGDPSFITSAANEANLGLSPTSDDVTSTAPTVPLVGISANDTGVIVSGTGTTDVTFTVYLTNAATADVAVPYAVIAPTAAELGAGAFGGTLPSGTVTISAGQTVATVSIDLAQGVLGTIASSVLDLQISNPSGASGVAVVAPTAQTTIINNSPEPGATLAAAAIALLSGDGATLSTTNGSLVLDLGPLTLNESYSALLSVSNDAAPPADDLSGGITETGAGFSTPESSLPLIAAGSAFQGLNIDADTSTAGTFTGTIEVNLEDLNLTGFAGSLGTEAIIVTDTVLSNVGVACYCPGTMIATPNGAVPIETLAIGNLVVTEAGVSRPIRWIGRRSYAGRFLRRNDNLRPVLFRSGSLADNVPDRDLLVSPLHAMLLDGVLVPAKCLLNGMSIVPAEPADQVDYIHLELDTHDIIFANGAASESFVDDDSRCMFHNAAEYAQLYPDAPRRPALYCAPRVEDGERLEAIRRRIAARAGAQPMSPGRLLGRIDHVGRDRIAGWARDAAAPDRAPHLRILANGVVLGEVVADRARPDGKSGFELHIPHGLSPAVRHVIEIQRVTDGQKLPGSPRVLRAIPVVTTAPPGDGSGRGRLDEATRARVSGWAQDEHEPEVPVALQVLDNGILIARVLANRYRPDLEAAGIGGGRHSFDLAIPGGLAPLERHVIAVRRERDGSELPGSPRVIEAADCFDGAMEQAISDAVTALDSRHDRDRLLDFMTAQIERLRQLQAAEDRGRNRRRTAHAAAPPPRALVVQRGSAVAAPLLSHLRGLCSLGYAVSFVAADMDLSETARGALAASGATLCGAPFYASVEDVLRRQVDSFELVWLHGIETAAPYMALARRYQPRARILYGMGELHHRRLAGQAAIEERPDLMAASRLLLRQEWQAAAAADAVITASPLEASLVRQAVRGADVHVVPWAVSVRVRAVPFEGRRGVAFIGSYDRDTDLDAAYWLVEAVMPLVWQANPWIGCVLAGANVPASVRRLAGRRVTIAGTEALDQVRLTVSPLRFGASVRSEVLDSLAAGVPCAMTETAAEVFAATPVLREMVGRDAAELAGIICRLYVSPTANLAAAKAGRRFVRQSFSGRAMGEALRKAAGEVALLPGRQVSYG